MTTPDILTPFNFKLSKDSTGVLVLDVQERQVPLVDRSCELVHVCETVLKGCQAFGLPIIVAEQHPEDLGHTVPKLLELLGDKKDVYPKDCFSCMEEPELRDAILGAAVSQWILVGLEAHVSILQTAKDLLAVGKQVVVLNDAVTSRSIFDFSTAIAELKDCGARISTSEIVLFELLRTQCAPEYGAIAELVR